MCLCVPLHITNIAIIMPFYHPDALIYIPKSLSLLQLCSSALMAKLGKIYLYLFLLFALFIVKVFSMTSLNYYELGVMTLSAEYLEHTFTNAFEPATTMAAVCDVINF